MPDDLEPTAVEQRAIDALKQLAKRWPKTLWLFSANGSLHVMRADPNGERYRRADGIDPDYILASIGIPNDGGDW